MNKKGVLFDWLIWSIRITLLAIVIYCIVAITISPLEEDLNTHDLDYTFLLNRLFYSPNSISYVDDLTGRVYPGIIDLSKFNEETLNKTLGTSSRFAVKITLGDKVIYNNKDNYDDMAHLVWSKAYDSVLTKKYIIVKDGEQKRGEVIDVEIVYKAY